MNEVVENFAVGQIVEHPTRTEWGPGKILAIEGGRLTICFRDILGAAPKDAVKIIDTAYVSPVLAAEQSDPFLDNLPPFQDGVFQQIRRPRITFQQGIERFHQQFPLYFEDPNYLGTGKIGERNYKVAAHELFQETLGNGKLRALLGNDDIDTLCARGLAVEARVNLLAIFEKAALREGLSDRAAAKKYFEALDAMLAAPEISAETFDPYIAAVENLPHVGNTSPAKWPVATALPYLAQPDRFMFLKPVVTQNCAASFSFDIQYSPRPNWLTYKSLLEMSHTLLERLQQYGARDMIDVQSFIWVVGGGYDIG